MSRFLVIRAGVRAAPRLREEGFHAALFDTLVGASGGPKWLVLRHLDEVLIDRVVRPRTTPLDTLGSSIGSFRHACMAQADPHAALARFAEAYVDQAYDGVPGPSAISRESDRILAHFLGPTGASEIVANGSVRSHFVAARLRNDRGFDQGTTFRLQLTAGAAWNTLSRRALARSFERVLFSSGAPAIDFQDLPTVSVALTDANLQQALLASGSIPLVMSGAREVPGVSGVLFDGGILDYHFDFAWKRRPGLVLFPHFFDRITPGWFDKWLPWRSPDPRDLEDLVLVAPSEAFIRSLPGSKIPDRDDFLALRTGDRMQRWRTVIERGRELAHELVELCDGRGLEATLLPLPK